MAPPSLDLPSKRTRHNIAEDAPQSIPGRDKLCTMTVPGKNQRPSVRSNDQYGDDGTYDGTHDGSYDGTYDDSYEDSWHREPRRRFTPYYESRHLKEHAPLLYGHQPSSPYRSSLYVASRRQRVSFKDAFENVSIFQDAFRHEFNKVS
jgi:hypothetical protein